MPRKLPWKTEPQGSPPTTTPKKQSPRPEPSTSTPDASTRPLVSRRRSPEHGSTYLPPPENPRRAKELTRNEKAPAGYVVRLHRRLQSRQPSITRPHPRVSPAHSSPGGKRFMIAGPAGDDRYRMVEDELLATAGLFTAHLHRAEYTRLKRLAAAQNAAAIREMERPVVPGPATATATRRRGRAARTAARRGLVRGEGTRGGSSLQGLMETPRGEGARLTGVGFGLGAASRPREAVVSARLPEEVGGSRDGEAPSFAGAVDDDDGDDDDDPFGVRQRRVRREKSREQMVRRTRRTGERETRSPKRPERDTIPGFF
ncbi:hypothetical protein E5D57_011565 [Metarhizium anisopliae]|nr:hypothetical protein E5D57_011565 [Metarhizium anisopliae]